MYVCIYIYTHSVAILAQVCNRCGSISFRFTSLWGVGCSREQAMTERSRSPPPSNAAEEQSQATVQSVQDPLTNMTSMFQKMMKQFEEMKGTQNSMKDGLGAMGIKIDDMEASANLKFESLEKRLDQHDLATNEIRNVRDGTSGGSGTRKTRKVETGNGNDVNMGGASEAGSSKDGGVLGDSGGSSKSWGAKPKSVSSAPNRLNRGDSGSSDAKGPGRAKAKDCRLWVKGFGRKLTKKTLEDQARMVISQINTGLGEGDKFCVGEKLRILAWNGESSVALIFSDLGDCERFYKRAGAPEARGRFEWSDPICIDGPKLLRVNKDVSFDQRLRSQVFYKNLRKEVFAHLEAKNVCNSEKMEIIDSGTTGTMFPTSDDEIYDLFKVDFNHKDGPSHYFKPVYESFFHPWAVEKEHVDGIVARAMAKVSLLERQVVTVEDE